MHEEFDRLSVSGEGEDQEEFEQWHQRVREQIPHVPACVAEHWLYRHGIHTPYDWLPLSRMRFKQETWELARILSIGEGVEPQWSPNWAEELETDPNHYESELGQYMLDSGTWPVPIIVLDNETGLQSSDDEPLARWHLIEGHMRSAYMDHLAKTGRAKETHQVWVTTIIDQEGPATIDEDKSSFTRGHQYFREAVRSMATGFGTLQDRTHRSYRCFMSLLPSDIPQLHGARSRFIEIIRRMERLRDRLGNEFTDQEARYIAIMMIEIHDTIAERHRDAEVARAVAAAQRRR